MAKRSPRVPALLRQLAGDPLGLGRGGPVARARGSCAPARPTRRPRRAVDLPVLRSRLRPEGLRQGRAGRADRGRPRLADLPRAAVPEGRGVGEPRQQPAARDQGQVPAPARHRVGGPRPRDGDGHDRRPRDRRPARETWEDVNDDGEPLQPHARAGVPRRRDAGHRGELPASRSASPRRARCRSRTRPAYDTPPRSPVWGPRSGAAAPPRSSRTCRTRTAS